MLAYPSVSSKTFSPIKDIWYRPLLGVSTSFRSFRRTRQLRTVLPLTLSFFTRFEGVCLGSSLKTCRTRLATPDALPPHSMGYTYKCYIYIYIIFLTLRSSCPPDKMDHCLGSIRHLELAGCTFRLSSIFQFLELRKDVKNTH